MAIPRGRKNSVSDVWDSDSNPPHPCELGQLLGFCASLHFQLSALPWCRDMISFSLGVYLGRSTFTFYLWLHWVFVAWHGLSLVAASRGYSPVAVLRLLTAVASQLWHAGNLVTLRHVESSWTRGQTSGACIGRQILNHWTTREVPYIYLCVELPNCFSEQVQHFAPPPGTRSL